MRQRAQHDFPHHAAALCNRLVRFRLALLFLARRERLFDGRGQKLGADGLFDIIHSAERNRRLQVFLVRVAADKNDLALRVLRMDLRAHLHAAHPAHPDIGEQNIRADLLALCKRLLGASSALHHADAELFPVHMPRKAVADRPLVVHDQQLNHTRVHSLTRLVPHCAGGISPQRPALPARTYSDKT